MTAQPIVHIGYHKATTAWFQQSFYPIVRNGRYVSGSIVREALIAPTVVEFRTPRARSQISVGARLPMTMAGVPAISHRKSPIG